MRRVGKRYFEIHRKALRFFQKRISDRGNGGTSYIHNLNSFVTDYNGLLHTFFHHLKIKCRQYFLSSGQAKPDRPLLYVADVSIWFGSWLPVTSYGFCDLQTRSFTTWSTHLTRCIPPRLVPVGLFSRSIVTGLRWFGDKPDLPQPLIFCEGWFSQQLVQFILYLPSPRFVFQGFSYALHRSWSVTLPLENT